MSEAVRCSRPPALNAGVSCAICIVFAFRIILVLMMIQPFFTVLVVSLISVTMLKPVFDSIFSLDRADCRKTISPANS
jgi:hypothetical protein